MVMRITEQQLSKIQHLLPLQRKPEDVEMINFLNGVLYIIENGCKWRALPAEFGNWHTIYTRFNRWCKNGVFDAIFLALQDEGIISIETEIVCLDSTSVKVHPDGTGALKKHGNQAIGRSKGGSQQRFMWLPRLLKVR
jgi:transposase